MHSRCLPPFSHSSAPSCVPQGPLDRFRENNKPELVLETEDFDVSTTRAPCAAPIPPSYAPLRPATPRYQPLPYPKMPLDLLKASGSGGPAGLAIERPRL